MNRRHIRFVAAVAVLTATIVLFVHYFATHPAVRHQLAQTSPLTLLLILVLYFGTMVAITLVNASTLQLCNVRLKTVENLLLTAYTAIINFFGPLQGGPAFRAIYVKRKHELNLKNYAVATLMYYFFFGAFSGLFLLSGLLKWWLVPLIAVGLLLMFGLYQSPWLKPRLVKLNLRGWYLLAGATLLQIVLITAIYFTELKSVDPQVTLGQAIIYTGAANFALFVSITPGAIGFREAFLVFSQRLHHIDASTIVAANVIDRAMYIVLLLIMAIFIFGTHAQRQFKTATQKD